jgi:FMN reductase
VIDGVAAASILVLVTPIYRATYSGILKVVFDQLPPDALVGKAAVLAATAGGPAHLLALDTGMRSLVASLGGWTVPTVTYATAADFTPGADGGKVSGDAVRTSLERALAEAASIAG